jgi:predicted nucleic acid-binding protein
MTDRLVVDSGVAIKWFLTEPYSTEASRILDEHRAGSLEFLAPDLIVAEVGNILWKKHTQQGVDEQDVLDALSLFGAIPFGLTSSTDLIDQALRIAIDHRRTVYDSLYVALCVREGCRFVTADEKLVNAVGTKYPNLIWVADWP